MESKGFARAVKSIKDTIHETLDIALGLEVDVQMSGLGDDRYALLGIVQICNAPLNPTACQTTAALTYFLFIDNYKSKTFRLGN